MSTPRDAPYKLAQQAALDALHASVRHARIDRGKLVQATLGAAVELRGARGTALYDRVERRFKSLWAMLTTGERRRLLGGR